MKLYSTIINNLTFMHRLALVLNLLKDFFERSKISFDRLRTSAGKNNLYFVILLTFPATTFCMQTKIVTISKSLKHMPYCTYIFSTQVSSTDIQKGRRDAYQKWCPQHIQWDNYKEIETINKLQLNAHKPLQKKESDYWKKFTTE
jgi:hypothetical protein